MELDAFPRKCSAFCNCSIICCQTCRWRLTTGISFFPTMCCPIAIVELLNIALLGPAFCTLLCHCKLILGEIMVRYVLSGFIILVHGCPVVSLDEVFCTLVICNISTEMTYSVFYLNFKSLFCTMWRYLNMSTEVETPKASGCQCTPPVHWQPCTKVSVFFVHDEVRDGFWTETLFSTCEFLN